MSARLVAIAAEREQLLRQIEAGRARMGGALRAGRREALTALAVAGAGRWLSRRFRWGPLAALALGLAAARLATRRRTH